MVRISMGHECADTYAHTCVRLSLFANIRAVTHVSVCTCSVNVDTGVNVSHKRVRMSLTYRSAAVESKNA